MARGLPEFSAAERVHVSEELADVLIYTVRLAHVCGIRLDECVLCGNQSFEAAPVRGELLLIRRRFLDARRGGAERIRLVQAGAESVTTWPT